MNDKTTEPRGTRFQSTDGLDLTGARESGTTRSHPETRLTEVSQGASRRDIEANIIVIAHPDGQRLGTRYRLGPGGVLEIGRSPDLEISLPEVPSISRMHARLHHLGPAVTVEDLGSTNGTFVNGELVQDETRLRSGDRFQVASVYFKFLHERDVEHAYYEAIYDLVTRDGLTDLANKRKYDEESAREFSRARRYDRALCLTLIDIDEFKRVNDELGHLCGDFVLKQFAARIRALLSPEQLFARVGGDEFVILAPEAELEGARVLAEKIRASLETADLEYNGQLLKLTCSCGVAELSDAMARPEELYEAADRALYRSKHAGRNQVSIAESG